MVYKKRIKSHRPAWIRRVSCVACALLVCMICVAPMFVPAAAYTDGPLPNRFVYMPMTVSIADTRLNYLTFPLVSAYSNRTTEFNQFFIRGDAAYRVEVNEQFGEEIVSTSIFADCDPLLPSLIAFRCETPTVLTGELNAQSTFFGITPLFGNYRIQAEISYHVQTVRDVRFGDGSAIMQYDWKSEAITYDVTLLEGEYWSFEWRDLEIERLSYDDLSTPTGNVVVDAVNIVCALEFESAQTLYVLVSQSSTFSNAGNMNQLYYDTTFTGFYELPEVEEPPAIGGDISDANFTQWITTAVGGFMDFELYPGISLGGILAVLVGIAMTIVFLKIFAGG